MNRTFRRSATLLIPILLLALAPVPKAGAAYWSDWKTPTFYTSAAGPDPTGGPAVTVLGDQFMAFWETSSPVSSPVCCEQLSGIRIGTGSGSLSGEQLSLYGGYELPAIGTQGEDQPAVTVFNGRVYLFFNTHGTIQELDPTKINYVFDPLSGTFEYADPTYISSRILYGPAATIYDGQLYLFATGIDHVLYDNVSSDGVSWSGWNAIGGQVYSGPAVTVFKGQLCAFAVLKNGHLYDTCTGGGFNVNLYNPGSTWSAWGYIDSGAFTLTPAVAVDAGGSLHVAVVGFDHQIYERSTPDLQHWSAWQSLGFSSSAPVTFTGYNGRLYLFAVSNQQVTNPSGLSSPYYPLEYTVGPLFFPG